jgi:tetratricopeptide (TPR) repeat protein
MRRRALVVIAVAVATGGAAGQVPDGENDGLPKGLESYLEARVLETSGKYREAMDAYAKAMQEAPDVNEVRLAYAGFLVDIGMAGKAVEVLNDVDDLDADGLRVRALALAQMSAQDSAPIADTETALREAVEANEGDPNLLFSLAQTLARQGESEEAEEIVAGLREGRPDNSQLVMLHAGLLAANGNSEEAADLYSQCAGSGPTAPTCREKLVDLLIEMGRPGEAGEEMLGWLGDMDLDSLMRAAGFLWEGRRLEQSLETVQRVLVQAPNSVRAQTLEAHLLSSLGRHAEAMAKLQRLLKKNPNDLDLILAMAWSTYRTGDQAAGRKWINRGWEQVENDAGSRQAVRVALTAARLELIADNPMVAREWLDRVGDVKLAGADYVRLLAETFRREEQWKEGVSALVRIQPHLEDRPQSEAEALEAEFLLRTGDQQRAWRRLRPLLDSDSPESVLLGLQVLQTLERWLDVDREAAAAIARIGENRDLLFIRAAALERSGQVEQSEELFRRLVAEEPDDASAANYLGYMWANREVHLDEALELIVGAVTNDPDNSAYLDSLGWVHYRLGDLDEAERWLRRAIDVDGNLGDGTIYCHLGEVLLAAGQPQEGRRFLLLGLDMGCEDSEHARSLLEAEDDGSR